MEKGELPAEPELQRDTQLKHKPAHKDWGESGDTKKKLAASKSKAHLVEEEENAIEQDEFFGEDEDS
jgi:hypothetical protein